MWCGIVDTGTVGSNSKKHTFILNWLALTRVTMNLLHYLPKSQMGSMVVHVDELMKCMTISSGCGHTQYIHLVNDLSGSILWCCIHVQGEGIALVTPTPERIIYLM